MVGNDLGCSLEERNPLKAIRANPRLDSVVCLLGLGLPGWCDIVELLRLIKLGKAACNTIAHTHEHSHTQPHTHTSTRTHNTLHYIHPAKQSCILLTPFSSNPLGYKHPCLHLNRCPCLAPPKTCLSNDVCVYKNTHTHTHTLTHSLTHTHSLKHTHTHLSTFTPFLPLV